MSNRETTHIPRIGAVSGAEHLNRLLRRSRQIRTNSRQAARNEYRAQERAISPTNVERGREDIFNTVADAKVSEQQPKHLEQDPVTHPMSDQITLLDAVTGISFPVEGAMAKLVLETFTAQYKKVCNRLLVALKSLIECIVKKVVTSTETIAHIAEAVIGNLELIALAASLVKLERRKYTDEKAKIEKHCRQHVEAGMKLNLLPFHSRWILAKRRPPIFLPT